jgi:hypothetical protein
MSADFVVTRDGWLNSSKDDAEARTITRLRISVLGEQVMRNISNRGGGESEAINTSLLPLAEFISNNWWPLLYEPLRPSLDDGFRVRHRLDSGMRGYAFPPIALWSAGERAIAADWASFTNPFSTISFLSAQPDEPAQLGRDGVEDSLMDLIETVLERADGQSLQLLESWNRVRDSISDADELSYCIAAGRLGLDPYDPEGPDLAPWADGIPETLFGDISEIVEVQELGQATSWLRTHEARLKLFPETNLVYFGDPASDRLTDPAWVAGNTSAQSLRAKTGVPMENPRAAVDELLGSVIADGGELVAQGPEGITALVQNLGSTARIGAVARSARQRRFRACAATYVAWTAQDGEDRAATEASTRRQQASRAFAAEMLAPQQTLIGRASRSGFDGDDLEDLASEFVCPYDTVMWQASRAGISLRGIEIPRAQKALVVTERHALR